MAQREQKEIVACPECGQALWYDQEYECWVCDECELEFYEEEEDWDDEFDEEEET